MDSRVRAGLFAGLGAAVATFLLSFVMLCLSGPLVAVIAGFNAGMQAVRDPRNANQAGSAGALAGLYAGLVVCVAQVVGILLTAAAERDYLQSALAQQGYMPALFWPSMIFAAIMACILILGIMAGCGALGAHFAAKRLYATPVPMYQRHIVPVPPVYPPPAPEPPAVAPTPQPPVSYPPPPSYYGLPDVPSEAASREAEPDAPATPEV